MRTIATNLALVVALCASAFGQNQINAATQLRGQVPIANGGVGQAFTYSKGDILCAVSSSALARLPVGSNTQVLTADSTQTCGLKWAASSSPTLSALIISPSGDTTGSTDTTAIQNAINASHSMLLTDGNYYIGAITVGQPASIIGNGPGMTVVNQTSTTNDSFTVNYAVASGITNYAGQGAVIRGFTLQPKSGVTPTAGCGFNVGTGSGSTFVVGLHVENVHINKLYKGVCTGTGIISDWFSNLIIDNSINLGIDYNSPIPSGDLHFDNIEMSGATTGLTIRQADATQFTNLKVNGAPITFTRAGATRNIRFLNPSVEGDFSTSTCGFDFGSGGSTPEEIQIWGGHINGVVTALCNSANVTNPMYGYTYYGIGASYNSNGTASNLAGSVAPAVTISTSGTVTPTLSAPAQLARYYRNGPAIYTLPTITSGLVGYGICIANYPTISSAISIAAPASTSLSVNGINATAATSGGALGDRACFTASSTTQYVADETFGTWSILGAFDSFTGTNGTALNAHTSNTGNTWSDYSALDSLTLKLNGSNQAVANSGSNNASAYSSYSPASADYTVGVDVISSVNSSSLVAGVLGRVNTGAATFYEAINIGGTCQLYKGVSGTFTQLGSNVTCNWANPSTHHIDLVMSGTSISMKVDGSTIIGPITDSAVSATGKAGIRLVNSSLAAMTNFTVQ